MIAVVFPGQGAQAPGMGQELYESNEIARNVFQRVSAAVGFDVADLCIRADEETLRQTHNAQIALFTTGLAAYYAWEEDLNEFENFRIAAMAGHSIGEYAALVAGGVYGLEDGAKLVQTRGRLMAEAGEKIPGTMAAVLGLSRELLEQACKDAGGTVVVANDNCPGQLIVSGEVEAVNRACELVRAAGAKRTLVLNVSGAFHSPLMDDAATEMGKALAAVKTHPPTTAIYSNVSSEAIADASHWPSLLERQLKSPVRWTETIEHMRRDGIQLFVECGWGDVLAGLIRRTDKEALVAKAADNASIVGAHAAVKTLLGEA